MPSRRLSMFAALALLFLAPLPGFAQGDEHALVVEQLQCRGAESTSCAYILSYVRLQPGDPVDEDELRNANYRLSALPNFTAVRIFLERGSVRGKANVVVEVTEASPLLAEGLVRAASHGAAVLGGRLSHQNLFGSGERLDFSAILRSPVEGPIERDTEYAQFQYVDPNLFAGGRYFLIAGAADGEDRVETRHGDEARVDATTLSVSLGRRIGDFSYLALRYEHLPTGNGYLRVNNRDGSIEIDETSFSRRLVLDYGWNSEDDPYFPTQGGRFSAALGLTPLDSHVSTDPEQDGDTGTSVSVSVGYRHTWSFAPDTFWTLDFGSPGTEYRSALDEGFLVSFGYARSLPRGESLTLGRRGRWYLDGGWNWLRLGDGQEVQEAGLEAGLRFRTKAFGMVELSLRATTETEW